MIDHSRCYLDAIARRSIAACLSKVLLQQRNGRSDAFKKQHCQPHYKCAANVDRFVGKALDPSQLSKKAACSFTLVRSSRAWRTGSLPVAESMTMGCAALPADGHPPDCSGAQSGASLRHTGIAAALGHQTPSVTVAFGAAGHPRLQSEDGASSVRISVVACAISRCTGHFDATFSSS